jgi:hypothetical protein
MFMYINLYIINGMASSRLFLSLLCGYYLVIIAHELLFSRRRGGDRIDLRSVIDTILCDI